jgi:hypothetical protein
MSFNRRGGPDRRPDRSDRPDRQDRYDRPPQRRTGGDWQPRERPSGDRPYQPRGDRPYTPRPRYDRPPDEGGMSIRLDPRRVNALKHLAGEAGVRPGDLVRQWVEERIDASRSGVEAGGDGLTARLEALTARVAALESAATGAVAEPPQPAPSDEPPTQPAPTNRRKGSPSGERVALHDEMIAVIAERGPLSAGELAQAISERGRYAPPRSGKPLDAAMVSQRVSNPTYRARFTRNEGRIGLAE